MNSSSTVSLELLFNNLEDSFHTLKQLSELTPMETYNYHLLQLVTKQFESSVYSLLPLRDDLQLISSVSTSHSIASVTQ